MRYVLPGLMGVCLCVAVILFGAVELHYAVIVYALAGLAALIWAGRVFLAETVFWKPSPIHWPVLGFVAYCFLHYFLSPYEYPSRMELFQVCLYGLVYFIIANNVNRSRERTIVIFMLLVLGTAEAMYGIWQAYTRSEAVLHLTRPSGFNTRASGTYVCPNHLAGLLEMVVAFALARLALYQPPERDSIQTQVLSKVMLAYAVLAMLAGILFTLSRGGWFATTIGFLLFLVWGGGNRRFLSRRIGVAAAALCVFGLLLFTVPRAKHYVGLTLSSRQQEGAMGLRDTSLKGRTMLWGATWRMIKDYPVLGTGAGTWQWAHQKYRHPRMQFTADYAHNDILQMTSDYGVIGFALVAAALGCFFWQARRLMVHGVTSEHRCFTTGAIVAVCILLVHSWFDFNLHIPANALLFCAILGLVAGMQVPEGPWAARPLGKPLRYLLGVALLLVVVAGLYFVLPAARAVKYTEWGDQEKNMLNWDAATELFNEAIRYDPNYIRPRTKLGDIYMAQAQFRVGEERAAERRELGQKAVEHYKAAFQLNRSRGNILAKLANAYEMAGDIEQARKCFNEAIPLDPNNINIHSRLALFLRRRGEEKEALQVFELIAKLQASPFTDWNLWELRYGALPE